MVNNFNDVNELKTYSVAEAADLMRISKDKVYEFLRAGKLPHLKMGTTRIRYTAIINFLDSIESTTFWESEVAC